MAIESPVFEVKAERAKREPTPLEAKSFHELTEKGAERVEMVKQGFVNLRDSVKGGISRLWSKAKGVGETLTEGAFSLPEVIASTPEIASHLFAMSRLKLQDGYESVGDFANGKMAEARFGIEKTKLGILDAAKDKYNSIENRGLDVLSNFNNRVADISNGVRDRVDTYRGDINTERRDQQIETLRDLIAKAQELGLNVNVPGMA